MIPHKPYDLMLVLGRIEWVPTKLPYQMHHLDEGAALLHECQYYEWWLIDERLFDVYSVLLLPLKLLEDGGCAASTPKFVGDID